MEMKVLLKDQSGRTRKPYDFSRAQKPRPVFLSSANIVEDPGPSVAAADVATLE